MRPPPPPVLPDPAPEPTPAPPRDILPLESPLAASPPTQDEPALDPTVDPTPQPDEPIVEPVEVVLPNVIAPPAVGPADDLPPGPIVSTVTTADQLVVAIYTGSRHIEINDHLDLRGYEPQQAEVTAVEVADEDENGDTSRRRLLSRRGLLEVPPEYMDNQRSSIMPPITNNTYTIKVRRLLPGGATTCMPWSARATPSCLRSTPTTAVAAAHAHVALRQRRCEQTRLFPQTTRRS